MLDYINLTVFFEHPCNHQSSNKISNLRRASTTSKYLKEFYRTSNVQLKLEEKIKVYFVAVNTSSAFLSRLLCPFISLSSTFKSTELISRSMRRFTERSFLSFLLCHYYRYVVAVLRVWMNYCQNCSEPKWTIVMVSSKINRNKKKVLWRGRESCSII